ncbi:MULTISPECIES: MaoC family dehydratase N-terminal domain-containing protein [Pseudomonas]|uniref:Mesaconyl-C(4)-CoA hydratase n=1 Tax=Pseudomonas fluorescens TaxID=294 RepID=A0A5E7TD85_PSEFL|nr:MULTISPECIES: MaoC family dehydratase N-terminal domain-containing protein [Pseudomonas]OPK06652.1 transposase [Pseudomonas sp. VI4.1]VVP93683.1 Mesaconyl-C(4)-CoA hydratase [Pseudomonas fluorescens]
MQDFEPGNWVGRTQVRNDQFSLPLVRRIAAMFNVPAPTDGQELPWLWHWCFFDDCAEQHQLGHDGHPTLGEFMPPAHGRNRMWAGSRVEFIHPLRVGACARRHTTIKHIEEKKGRTGSLLFVTLAHDLWQDEQLCISEEQDIVYREPNPPKLSAGEPLPETQWSENISPDPLLLFRYSAVTFNAHRIHFDWPYVTGTEGYPGLVVHGPLTATLNLAAFVQANPLARVRQFSFRGIRPLIAPARFKVGGHHSRHGFADLWAGDETGISQHASVEFD